MIALEPDLALLAVGHTVLRQAPQVLEKRVGARGDVIDRGHDSVSRAALQNLGNRREGAAVLRAGAMST